MDRTADPRCVTGLTPYIHLPQINALNGAGAAMPTSGQNGTVRAPETNLEMWKMCLIRLTRIAEWLKLQRK